MFTLKRYVNTKTYSKDTVIFKYFNDYIVRTCKHKNEVNYLNIIIKILKFK